MKTDGAFLDLLLSQRDGKPKMTVGLLHPSAAFSLRKACTASGSFGASGAARSSSLSHLTWQLEIFLNLTWEQKSWQGKAAQQPHLVLCTSDYARCPAPARPLSHYMLCKHSTDWLCSFLITPFSQCTLAKLKGSGQKRRWPVQYQHSLWNTLYQHWLLRKAAPHSHQGIGNTNLGCSAKPISNTSPTAPNCKALLQVCLSLYHTLTVTLCICCRLTIESCSW